MLKFNRNKTRGDTLIEVLFAITIFSLVAVGGLSIMNQGTATSQRALEITLVRQEVDAQAETLRFLNSSYISAYQTGALSYPSSPPAEQWRLMQSSIIAMAALDVTPFGIDPDNPTVCPTAPAGSFILNTRTATFIPSTSGKLGISQTFSQVRYDISNQVTTSEGLWIEAVRSATVSGNNQENAGYIDFHIRACWDSPGQSVPVTIGTIVRLYEPRG